MKLLPQSTRARFAHLVASADAKRDRRDWSAAIDDYRAALSLKPKSGIKVQLAHCLKETARYEEAFAIYEQVAAEHPEDDDLQLQIGHLEKTRGDFAEARRRYENAMRLNPSNRDAALEILPLSALPDLASDAIEPVDSREQLEGTQMNPEQIREGASDAQRDSARNSGVLSAERVSALREEAGLARHNQLWWKDAYAWRRVCESPFSSGHDWLQYGHALKELGFANQAEDAYVKAKTALPEFAEIPLQIAKLARQQGRFEKATSQFRNALAFPDCDKEQIERELQDIRVYGDTRLGSVGEKDEDVHIYLSAPSGLVLENDVTDSTRFGAADYSYSFAMKGFIHALEELQYPYTLISNPEWIPDIRDRSNAKVNIHLAFHSPERLRLLKGAVNVACFAWEFERLRSPTELNSFHAFADQVKMLNITDEIWTPSRFSADVVGRATSKPVRYVPAPVPPARKRVARGHTSKSRNVASACKDLRRISWEPLAILPRLQASMNAISAQKRKTLRSILNVSPTSKIFITVASVHDYRKQLRSMFEGFADFLASEHDALLLVKLTSPHGGRVAANSLILDEQMANPAYLIPPVVSERIWIAAEKLTREEMDALYNVADFYLCTSHCEGQNLPLLEAMAAGVVPVSVGVTAMQDYLSPENAVLIETHRQVADPRLALRYQMYGFSIDTATPEAVSEALSIAARLPPEAYDSFSTLAVETVEQDFGSKRIKEAIDRLVGPIDHLPKEIAE